MGFFTCHIVADFLEAQSAKNLPAMQENQVPSLGWEDPLEKEMATTPVFLPGKSHRQRSLVWLQSLGLQELNN